MTDGHPDILREATELLAECRTACLATVDEHGIPHAANIQYAHDDSLRLYFVSSEDAAHSLHIKANPAVAITVYHHDDSLPENLHGLQLHARAEPIIDEATRNRAMTLYAARFPFISEVPALRAAVEQQTFYRLTPTWLRLIDNRRGFGWKIEMDTAENERG